MSFFALLRAFARRCCSSPLPVRMLFAPSLVLAVTLSGVATRSTSADVIDFFVNVGGTPTGDFGWDDFGTTGSPYAGPHAPDQFSTGTGEASLIVNTGGIITSTANLYSFFSTPEWSLEFTELDATNSFTSFAIQIATSAPLDSSHFTMQGTTADEFIDLGQRAEIGGFDYNFYWAEWQGLTASDSLSISISGTGQHESFAGAKASYFNTSSSFNITAVPEPTSAIVLLPLAGLTLLRRRRRKR